MQIACKTATLENGLARRQDVARSRRRPDFDIRQLAQTSRLLDSAQAHSLPRREFEVTWSIADAQRFRGQVAKAAILVQQAGQSGVVEGKYDSVSRKKVVHLAQHGGDIETCFGERFAGEDLAYRFARVALAG